MPVISLSQIWRSLFVALAVAGTIILIPSHRATAEGDAIRRFRIDIPEDALLYVGRGDRFDDDRRLVRRASAS